MSLHKHNRPKLRPSVQQLEAFGVDYYMQRKNMQGTTYSVYSVPSSNRDYQWSKNIC